MGSNMDNFNEAAEYVAAMVEQGGVWAPPGAMKEALRHVGGMAANADREADIAAEQDLLAVDMNAELAEYYKAGGTAPGAEAIKQKYADAHREFVANYTRESLGR